MRLYTESHTKHLKNLQCILNYFLTLYSSNNRLSDYTFIYIKRNSWLQLDGGLCNTNRTLHQRKLHISPQFSSPDCLFDDGKIKARGWGREHLHGQSWWKHFISCQIHFAVQILCCRWILCQTLIFKASLAGLPLSSWEAPNNGIISDKVLRVDLPFLPLHKHRLKCVQLCMIPLQHFCLL